MNSFQALIIGIIQGLTEYIPISSTAHIKVIPSLLGWPDPGAAFTAVIQWGTLVAAIIYFWSDIVHITEATLTALFAGKPMQTPEAKMGWMIALGTVPVVIAGLVLKKHIEGPLRSLYVISATAIVMALVLMAAEWVVRWRERVFRKQKDMGELGWWDALGVGIAQAFAIVPGASRSGVTITCGLFLGIRRDTAARFSFLLSLPAVFGAGLFELFHERKELLHSQGGVLNLVIATVVSGIVGYATIAFLLAYLKRHTTYLFIVYRIVLGVSILVLLSRGWLHDSIPTPAEESTTAVASRSPG
jgi:undecaprenyl-diphosphatase